MQRAFCPLCGTSLAKAAKARRQRKVWTVQQWQDQHRKRYNDYMRGYMQKYRQRKREAASQ
jgi:hypothetical protein